MDKIRSTVIAIAQLSAAIALGVVAYKSSVIASDIKASRRAVLFETMPKISLEELQRRVQAMPLQPDLLHGLIAHRVKQRDARVLDESERSALQSLGWQSTVIQLDLYKDGLNRSDVNTVVTRIDGLLRRGKMTEELVNVLIEIEQVAPQTRRMLVDLLADKPNWRRDFLTAPEGFAGADAVAARASTLNMMFDQKLSIKREEVAPIVNGLEVTGKLDQAEKLWRKFHHIPRPAPRPYDPNFNQLASTPLDSQHQTMAYEWRTGSGAGYSAEARQIGSESPVLNITWDGRAAPVFIRQRLISEPGRFEVSVDGVALDPGAMRRIAFVFYCGGRPIFHDLVSRKEGRFVYSANEPVTCANPEMRLVGMPQDSSNPLEIELTSIWLQSRGASRPNVERPPKPTPIK